MPLVTFVQLCPPLRVTWTCPSLVPAQIVPFCTGDSAIENSVAPSQVIRLSAAMPALLCWWDLSFKVRSGLISFQVWPPSLVMCTYWLPT